MAKSIKRNALASTLLKVLNIVFPIIVGPYLARTLGEVDYGEFNRAATAVSWLLPFASFGIYNYGIRQISKVRNDKEKMSQVFTCLFIMGCISCFTVSLIYIFYCFFMVEGTNQFLYLASGGQIFSLFCYVEWMNEAFENYDFILVKTFLIRILNIVLVFLLVRKPDDIIAYAMIISVICLLNYLISFIYIKSKVSFAKIKLGELKKYVSPLVSMLLLSNAGMLFTSLDRLFLSMQDDGVLISYYTFSSTLIMMITQVINSLVIVTIPRLSQHLGQKEWSEYTNLLHLSSRSFFLLGIPMCIGMACFADAAMLIYGDQTYIAAGSTLSMFGIRTLLWLADQSMATQVLFINGYEKNLTKFYFICGGINFLLDLCLFQNGIYRPEYYVLTTMISEVVLVTLEYIAIRRNIGKEAEVLNRSVMKYLFLSFTFIPIFLVGSKLLDYTYVMDIRFLLETCFMIGICIFTYFSVLYITKDNIVHTYANRILHKIFKS